LVGGGADVAAVIGGGCLDGGCAVGGRARDRPCVMVRAGGAFIDEGGRLRRAAVGCDRDGGRASEAGGGVGGGHGDINGTWVGVGDGAVFDEQVSAVLGSGGDVQHRGGSVDHDGLAVHLDGEDGLGID